MSRGRPSVVALCVLALQLAWIAHVQCQDLNKICGEDRGSTGWPYGHPCPFGIQNQVPGSFTPPGTNVTQKGQYTLAYFKADNTSFGAYTEFQNQNSTLVFNPPCYRAFFGDPTFQVLKTCYGTNWAAASTLPTYIDTLHLTTAYNDPLWVLSVKEGQYVNPFPDYPTFVYVIRFGASGQYHYSRVSGNILCANTFLADPLPNQVKTCEVLNHLSSFSTIPINQTASAGNKLGTWVLCAKEGQYCTVNTTTTAPTLIRYGVVNPETNPAGTILFTFDSGNQFLCGLQNMDVDPAPYYVKACWYLQPSQ